MAVFFKSGNCSLAEVTECGIRKKSPAVKRGASLARNNAELKPRVTNSHLSLDFLSSWHSVMLHDLAAPWACPARHLHLFIASRQRVPSGRGDDCRDGMLNRRPIRSWPCHRQCRCRCPPNPLGRLLTHQAGHPSFDASTNDMEHIRLRGQLQKPKGHFRKARRYDTLNWSGKADTASCCRTCDHAEARTHASTFWN